jgi:hypothetical protein
VVPSAPAELLELIHQLLDKDPQKRPPTALVVGNRLKSVQQALKGKSLLAGENNAASPALEKPSILTSHTAIGKKLTSIDMDDEEVRLTHEELSELGRESVTKRSDDTRDQPTVVASASMLRRAALTGKEDPIENELSSEHLSASPETNHRRGATSPSEITNGGTSKFTPVTESDGKSFTIASSSPAPHQGLDWTQILSLAGIVLTLVASVGIVWWMLQPESADRLFSGILTAVESGDDAQLLGASNKFDQFLARFPDDERAIDVKGYRDEADLIRRVKNLQRKAARAGGANELSAAEQAFLDAIHARSEDFQLGQEKLAALVSLFAGSELDASDARLIELAQYAKNAGTSVSLSKDPLAKTQLADMIQTAERAMTPERLKRFYENVTLLYADKPWAKEQIARIRKKLEMEP